MKYLSSILIVLLFAGLAVAGESYECSYYRKDKQDMAAEKGCLTNLKHVRTKTMGSDAQVSRKVLAAAAYDENGLGFLFSPVGVFYFNRSGLARKTLNFDNGPDYFQEGLARTERNGKIGFFDKKLLIVIKPRFDFAFPFKNGLAVVCNGCTRKKLDEHTVVVGGKWGAINTQGKIVKPVAFSESAMKALLK